MENQSKFDPTRKTVGAIYQEAKASYDGSPILAGDMTHELQKSLVDDINDCISGRLDGIPFGGTEHEGRPYYLMVHETKDLLMKTQIKRRLLLWKFRPYPESDTLVFYVNPKTSDVRFCWCLPHWSEMDNMLANSFLYDQDMIKQIRAWKSLDLRHFGFVKTDDGQGWMANPHWKDQPLTANKGPKSQLIL